MSTKEGVLSVLEQNREREVSGQEISQMLGVSRTAVWKAIEALRAEGHSINAVTNRGYRLSEKSGLLSEPGVRAFLPPELRDMPITVYKSVGSTNDEAKRLAVSGAGGRTLLLAEQQTAGRGRLGRSFFSPGGEGVYMSLILRPQFRAQEAALVTIAAAVAVCRAVSRLTGERPGVKWVNDLYLNGKKICGILSEAVSDFESGAVECVVIGVGLNCGRAGFPGELGEKAGALELGSVTRNELAAQMASELISLCSRPVGSAVVDEYRSLSIMTGKKVRFERQGEILEASVSGISDDGGLIVRLDGGKSLTLYSGEVSLISFTL